MNTTETARWAQGYADAAGWLPSATPDELRGFAVLEYTKGTIFIYGDHSLAAYWNAAEPVGYGSVPVGDIDPWDNGYGRGFYEALHDGRPEIFAGSA
jgi:hypothetical protein